MLFTHENKDYNAYSVDEMTAYAMVSLLIMAFIATII